MFVNTKSVSSPVHSVVLPDWVQTWHCGHCSVKWVKKCAVSLNSRSDRGEKKANPVILFKIRKDLVLIGALCVCATPSSLMLSEAKLVPVHLPEQHDLPLQSVPQLF